MSSIAPVSTSEYKDQHRKIEIQMPSKSMPIQTIIESLSSLQDPLDVFCWYEGTQGISAAAAAFSRTSIIEPLLKAKEDAKIYLYSLRGWDFKKSLSKLAYSSSLSDEINKINSSKVQCLEASAFFRYCLKNSYNSQFYDFTSKELPKKKWVVVLSSSKKDTHKTVSDIFENHSSLFDCIKKEDAAKAYSAIQYIEAYYLIQKAIETRLYNNPKCIEIAFVLPNDEGKYYLDLPQDIEKMLQINFGRKLDGINIHISFHSFEYGNSVEDRPYINRDKTVAKVDKTEIKSYFDFLSQKQKKTIRSDPPDVGFVRDLIHNIPKE